MSLAFVTSNKHKFAEAVEVAKAHEIPLEHIQTPYIEIQADELPDVSSFGAKDAAEKTCAPCFVEDAGLFINALGGFPGPYSAFVYRTLGNPGVLKLMDGISDRRAEFRSAVGYCEPGRNPEIFEGVVKGRLTTSERGSSGFGFDPIFVADDGDGRTFAEMSVNEKNTFSHRSRAIQNFLKWYSDLKKA